MNKEQITEYFDNRASNWDSHNYVNPNFLKRILDYAEIDDESKILDVACGTGVLMDSYLSRNVKWVTAIDLSQEMIKHAKKKYSKEENISFICGDALEMEFPNKFNRIMIFNAFPHFPNPEETVKRMAELLESGGRLTIAHSMSKKELDDHHKKVASDVSINLLEAEELKEIFSKYLKTDVCISDDIYIVSGIK